MCEDLAVVSWVRFSDRHAAALIAFGVLASAVGAWGTVRLYSDLRADVAELLPSAARSAADAAAVTARVGGWAEETVALHGPDANALRRFADALAPRLEAIPDLVASVEYRLDDAARFFAARRWLFVPLADLEQIRERLAAGDLAAVQAIAARLEAEAKESGATALFDRFPGGYFEREVQDPAGRTTQALVLRVRLAGNPNDYPRVDALDRAVRRAVADVGRDDSVAVSYGGYVAANKFEHEGLAEDLLVATSAVMLAVALVIALYFRTAKAVLAIGPPLVAGVLVTFGVADLAIGHVNSNTAFLGSIVVGNGINSGLILFARYAEERRRDIPPLEAMTVAVASTWLATLTAALGAAIAYGSLAVTDFRGFAQFGLIGSVGMIACWLTTYAFVPPLALLWERHGTLIAPKGGPRRALVMHLVASAVERAPRRIAFAAAALAVAAAVLAVRFARDPMEYDFGKLRDSRALNGGGPAFWEDAVFGGHHDPCVVLARDENEARAVAAAFDARRRDPESTIGVVLSIASFVPVGQPAKLPVIDAMRDGASPVALALLPSADLRPFTAAELPPILRRRLTERDGTVGTPVLVYPRNSVSVWDGRDALRVAADLRSVELPRSGLPMASSLLVFADVLHAISRDGPRATVVSFVGVALLVLVLFRARREAALVLFALTAGVLLFGGVAGALGLKLNMLSFIALPITFGIGVDYATNLVQRRSGGATWGECLRTTGGAVALCSLTTIIGYSSLLMAHNQALQSFGLLADLGELACLGAALVVLPAVALTSSGVRS
jgi:predicted exporter